MMISRNHTIWLMRTAALVFGAATIRSGGSVLFGDGAPAAGNVVGFVLWFNFLAGFAYVVAAGGAFEARTAWAMALRCAMWILIALLTLKGTKRDDSARSALSGHH